MTKTVLLTIGRMPKALDIARSFKAAGWRVVVADPFRWHLSRVSNAVAKTIQVRAPGDGAENYQADLLDIVRRERVDLVVPISEETMYVAGLKGRLPDGVSLYVMPQDIVLRLHSKHAFIAWAADLGMSVPETHMLEAVGATQLAASRDTVVKPVYSCSGRGIAFHKAGAQLPAPDPNETQIVQEKINGTLFSTFSIAHQGRALINVVYRAAVLSGTVAVCFERVDDALPVTNWIDQFVQRTNYSGFISFDVIVDVNGIAYAIECNPRVTSGAHFVHPGDLARAVFDPGSMTTVRLRDNRFMQQFYPCLTETQLSLLDWPRFRTNLGCLRTARDVTWDSSDPVPFLTMPFTGSQILVRSIQKKQSFGEASTFDISWRDPSSLAS